MSHSISEGFVIRRKRRQIRLIISGDRERGRFLVKLDGREVWLGPQLFLGLCKLVKARCSTETGYAREAPVTIFRLRKALCANDDMTTSLIATGHRHEYRLSLAAREICVESGFRELAAALSTEFPELEALSNMARRRSKKHDV